VAKSKKPTKRQRTEFVSEAESKVEAKETKEQRTKRLDAERYQRNKLKTDPDSVAKREKKKVFLKLKSLGSSKT